MFYLWLIVIIGGGLIAGLSAGIIAKLRKQASMSVKDFLISGGTMPLWQMVGTTVATTVGAGTVVGIVESTYQRGPGYGLVVWMASIFGFLLMAYLAPRIRSRVAELEVYNLPDMLGQFYGRKVELTASVVLVTGLLGVLAGQLLALEQILPLLGGSSLGQGWGQALTLIAGVGGVILYGSVSGLKGSIRADVVYFVAKIAGLFLTIWGLAHTITVPQIQALPAEYLSPLTFGGWTFLLGGLVLGGLTVFLSMDQWIRIWAADSTAVARRGLYISIPLVAPFFLAAIAMGWAGHILLPADTPHDHVYADVIRAIQSPGAAAFVLAALSAVILSASNMLIFGIASIVGRNILQFKEENLLRLRVTLLVVGVLAAGVALLAQGVVTLILGAYYIMIGLLPPILSALFNIKTSPKILVASMAAGALVAFVSYQFIGETAFVPTLLISMGIWSTGLWSQRRASV